MVYFFPSTVLRANSWRRRLADERIEVIQRLDSPPVLISIYCTSDLTSEISDFLQPSKYCNEFWLKLKQNWVVFIWNFWYIGTIAKIVVIPFQLVIFIQTGSSRMRRFSFVGSVISYSKITNQLDLRSRIKAISHVCRFLDVCQWETWASGVLPPSCHSQPGEEGQRQAGSALQLLNFKQQTRQ